MQRMSYNFHGQLTIYYWRSHFCLFLLFLGLSNFDLLSICPRWVVFDEFCELLEYFYRYELVPIFMFVVRLRQIFIIGKFFQIYTIVEWLISRQLKKVCLWPV